MPTMQPTTEAFAFAIPDAPTLDGSEPTPVVAEVLASLHRLTESVTEAAESVASTRGLNDDGKRLSFTTTAERVLGVLADLDATLDTEGADLLAQTEALDAPTEPQIRQTESEKRENLAIAERFAFLRAAERDARLGDVVSGRDPQLARALATVHPAVTGLSDTLRTLIAEKVATGRRARDTEATRDAIARRAMAVRRTRDFLDGLRLAVIRASDYGTLHEAGLAPKRVRDMSDADKAAFIGAHGLSAWERLLQEWP